jgi:hypothetical protein
LALHACALHIASHYLVSKEQIPLSLPLTLLRR